MNTRAEKSLWNEIVLDVDIFESSFHSLGPELQKQLEYFGIRLANFAMSRADNPQWIIRGVPNLIFLVNRPVCCPNVFVTLPYDGVYITSMQVVLGDKRL